MAGAARFTALLDACVLYPPVLADALVSLHVAGLYAARWTARIDLEWMGAVLRGNPLLREPLERRCNDMHQAVPDWEVDSTSYESIASGLQLPDANDVHVLAAAIAGHADCIITANIKHFPSALLHPHGLEAIHPDNFLVYQLELQPFAALAVFKEMRVRRKAPSLTPDQFIERVERNGLVDTAERLREARDLI